MGQVGHADSKMTVDVYAQLEQRVDRSHGTSFDQLVRKAREQVAGLSLEAQDASFGPRIAKPEKNRPPNIRSGQHGKPRFAGKKRNGETGTRTRDTTIFSRVLYQLSYLAENACKSALLSLSRGGIAPPCRPTP